jgi:hypothetical protein
MENYTAKNRKNILIRGLQMLLFGLLINLGLTITGFLAFFSVFLAPRHQRKKFIYSGISISSW